ncbi:aldehyde dehydrogenase (NADP(+)) [Streptomyces sp. NBC_01012]|uniref:aldehyde dehydrogenase (NADP(+)) n=1 Tax=Streptomyces sp. NBC_01012 TaxID=2903717 RepID=UPI00386D7BEE|nr:aldehyde dehydrogenase (NADP(+)) [Streptomyces sp. NBC_01012]
MSSETITTANPSTGVVTATALQKSTDEEVAAACAQAAQATAELAALGRPFRSALLRRMAAALDAEASEIVAIADQETALGSGRLEGELTRTTYQLRLLADVVDEGGYLEATVDHAAGTPMGPRPDLRRMLVPLGPVAVFGASNFPLAFSVPGGDTASALAAGCAVVVKAHSSHPLTSALCGRILREAADAHGAPAGTLSLIHGTEAGRTLVTDPRITAVAFTGGHTGAAALKAAIATRPVPIPFYGELGGVNPLVITPRAADERGTEIAHGLVDSFTLGGGQFCTKPGLVFVPEGHTGDELVSAVRSRTAASPIPALLNKGIAGSYHDSLGRLAPTTQLTLAQAESGEGFRAPPAVAVLDSEQFDPSQVDEVFGPVALLVRYHPETLNSVIEQLPGALVGTVHGATGDDPVRDSAASVLAARCGRVLFDGYPTGVAVTWAQQHGGPWPATDNQHTSVGPAGLRRFLRPLSWQNSPAHLLPPELREDTRTAPRRVDGLLQLPRP